VSRDDCLPRPENGYADAHGARRERRLAAQQVFGVSALRQERAGLCRHFRALGLKA
jgi:hypothetical protein